MTVQTAANATKNLLITNLVQKELAFGVKIANSGIITDLSQFAVKGSKEVHMPKLTGFTAASRVAGAAYVPSVLTDSVDILALNKIEGLSYVQDGSLIQSTIAWELEAAKRAASALARKIESSLVSGIIAAGTAVGTAGNITKAIVLDAREALLKANADMNNVVLVISPNQESALLGLSDFTQAFLYGAPNSPLYDGLIGKVFGIPVVVSNALGDADFFFIEKSGYAVAYQAGPDMGSMPDVNYGPKAFVTSMEVIYGHAPMQASAGVSPLIIKAGV